MCCGRFRFVIISCFLRLKRSIGAYTPDTGFPCRPSFNAGEKIRALHLHCTNAEYQHLPTSISSLRLVVFRVPSSALEECEHSVKRGVGSSAPRVSVQLPFFLEQEFPKVVICSVNSIQLRPLIFGGPQKNSQNDQYSLYFYQSHHHLHRSSGSLYAFNYSNYIFPSWLQITTNFSNFKQRNTVPE